MKRILFFLLLLPFSIPLHGQYERKLEQSIRLYNRIKVQYELEGVSFQKVEQSLEVADLLLKEVMKYGSEPESKSARYFYTLKELLKGEMLFRPDSPNRLLGEQLLLGLSDSFQQLDGSFFPVRYFYEDEYFVVDYDDFVGTRFRYFAEITELYYRKGEFDLGRKYARFALQMGTKVDPYLSFFLMTYLLDMDPTAVEIFEYSLLMVRHYQSMEPTQQQQLNEDDQFATKALYTAFDQLAKDSLTIAYLDSTGTISAEIAERLLPYVGFDSLATLFFEHAAIKRHPFPYTRSWDVLKLLDHYQHYPAAKQLCQQISTQTPPTACYDLQRLSSYFAKYGEPSLAQKYTKKAKKCTKKPRKAATLAAPRR